MYVGCCERSYIIGIPFTKPPSDAASHDPSEHPLTPPYACSSVCPSAEYKYLQKELVHFFTLFLFKFSFRFHEHRFTLLHHLGYFSRVPS